MRRPAASLALLTFLLAAPASAALVVFEDGRYLKVSAFEVVDDQVTLSLRAGGTMTIPLVRVDRIIDDELPPAEAPPPGAPAVAAAASRSVRAPLLAELGRPYEGHIRAAAKEHRIDPALVAAVIQAESNYQPRAISRKGARGLMQLMPATARRLGVRSAFDPRENIRGGTAYLSELADRFGDTSVDLILAAYNAGERAVESHGGIPPYRETQDYVRKVRSIWERLHERG